MQDRHLVGNHIGEIDVVSDDDGRVTDAGPERDDQLGDEARVGGVESCRRLVEEDDLRLHHERARDADALAHAARQLGRHQLVRAGHAHQGQEAVDAVADLAQRHPRVLAERIGDVLEDGERVEERGALKHETGALANREHGFLPHPLDPHTEQRNLTPIGPDESVRDPEEDRLAGTAAAQQDHRLAMLDVEVQPVQDAASLVFDH